MTSIVPNSPCREIPLSNGGVALVDAQDYPFLVEWKWKRHTQGYASRTTYRDGTFPCLLMHRVIVHAPGSYAVDHINRNKLDNRRVNLRAVPHWLNMLNNPAQRNNTSGLRGVVFMKGSGKWRALIQVEGCTHRIGYFHTASEASAAYESARSQFVMHPGLKPLGLQ